MSAPKPITIVGGGLAGLTLGIGLRQRDVPVTIWETGQYPRHRVCGEFISGRGQDTLGRLGLENLLEECGALPARTARFFTANHAAPVTELPEAAQCVSRHALDHALAKRFRSLGGQLLAGQRWAKPDFGEAVVRATGRRSQPHEGGWRWFGLKVHARNVHLEADQEMHLLPNGYVGIGQLADGWVNICGLFRRPAGESAPAESIFDWLRGPEGSHLRKRWESAEVEESSRCAVAGLSLTPQRATDLSELCIGDSVTMIPPVTGNGMSMAFESAAFAIEPIHAFSRGEISWSEARRSVATQCDQGFRRRLQWASSLQRLLFLPAAREMLVRLVPGQLWLWQLLFSRTR